MTFKPTPCPHLKQSVDYGHRLILKRSIVEQCPSCSRRRAVDPGFMKSSLRVLEDGEHFIPVAGLGSLEEIGTLLIIRPVSCCLQPNIQPGLDCLVGHMVERISREDRELIPWRIPIDARVQWLWTVYNLAAYAMMRDISSFFF